MDARLDLIGRRTQGLLTPAMLRQAGLRPELLSRAAAAGDLVRLRHGVYAAPDAAPLPRYVVDGSGVSPLYVRHVRAVLLSLGRGVAARLRTAAALYGWALLREPTRTVEVAVRHGRGRVSATGVHVSQHRVLDAQPVAAVAGRDPLMVTSPLRTVLDAMRELPRAEALALCDSALRARHVGVEELVREAAACPGARAAARAREVVGLCDPACGSVLESLTRLRMHDAGLDGFRTQAVLRRWPELRVDFCFDRERLVVEVDGQKWHPDPAVDRQRDNVLAALGWRVLRFTWDEVVHAWPAVLAQLQEALGREGIHLAASPARAAA
ncbi:MAG: DUF559 domain-containing protein [Mycobacteriales bacterium]